MGSIVKDGALHDPLVIIGSGGHAKVVIEVAQSLGHTIVGCTGHDTHGDGVLGVPYIGNDDELVSLVSSGVKKAFVALGDNKRRDTAAERAVALGFELVTLVSPHAHISPSSRIGAGSLIMPGAILNASAIIERLVIINTGATVDHDCIVSDCAHIAPGAHLSGGVQIGKRVLVGTGTAIIPQITVGHDTTVGAGSVVVKHLPAHCVAFGNPARPQPLPFSRS